jgi:hypothetical protein
MQQVLDDHSRMKQMMPQILASTNDNLPQDNLGSKEPRGETEITLLACKLCGEIGHTPKGCCEQCPYCDMSHPVGECPMTHGCLPTPRCIHRSLTLQDVLLGQQ